MTSAVRKRLATIAVVAVASAGCATGRDAAEPASSSSRRPGSTVPTRPARSPGCSRDVPAPRGTTDHTLVSRGVERAYQLVVPDTYDGTEPYAIVLGLHALTVDHHFVAPMAGFDRAGRYHFIGVSPSGRRNDATPFWNAAPVRDNYDVAFIRDLLDHLEHELCVDPSKVFATGMSNGAQMSSLLACRLSDRIAGIAPISGEEYLEPCTGTPVPIMAFHGTVDPILPYTGGGLSATRIAAAYFYDGHPPAGLPAPLGIDASMRRWAAHNHCDPTPKETQVAPHVRRRAWQRCDAATVLYIVQGAGHSWPGKRFPQFEAMFGPGTTEIDATDLMFRFFFGSTG